jgi:hypothetical protein
MKKSYTAYFYTDAEYASTCIEASNPQEALKKAIDINELQDGDGLSFDHYDHRQPVNHIEIFDDDRNQLAQWRDDDLLVRLAAPKLLHALQSIRLIPLSQVSRYVVSWPRGGDGRDGGRGWRGREL